MKRGKLIVIEGGDAAGKCTQTKRLMERLEEHRHVEQLAEDARYEMPGQEIRDLFIRPAPKLFSFPRYGTPVGAMILAHLKGEVALGSTEILDDEESAAFKKGYSPTSVFFSEYDALQFQCAMLADKVHASVEINRALASGSHVVCDRWWHSSVVYGTLDDDMLREWLGKTSSTLPQADVNILIDVPMEVAMSRRPAARDRYESDVAHRSKVAGSYQNLWSDMRGLDEWHGREWVVVDGSPDADAVSSAIWEVVSRAVD